MNYEKFTIFQSIGLFLKKKKRKNKRHNNNKKKKNRAYKTFLIGKKKRLKKFEFGCQIQ